ncbi:hypothetical protein IYC_08235 [Clostridium sporogenes PA 3679]|nr:hypothetical protein IYC_08235 [Clostridium sporogenes PA 3679]
MNSQNTKMDVVSDGIRYILISEKVIKNDLEVQYE